MPLQATQSVGHRLAFGRQKRQSWGSTQVEDTLFFGFARVFDSGRYLLNRHHSVITMDMGCASKGTSEATQNLNGPRPSEGTSPFPPASLQGVKEQYGEIEKGKKCCKRLQILFTYCAALCSVNSFPQMLSMLPGQGEGCYPQADYYFQLNCPQVPI